MTMTTDRPTDQPSAPAWLNLGLLVRPEVVERMAALVAEGEALRPQIEDLARRIIVCEREYSDGLHDVNEDDVMDLVGRASGHDRFYNYLYALGDDLLHAVEGGWGSRPVPAWAALLFPDSEVQQ